VGTLAELPDGRSVEVRGEEVVVSDPVRRKRADELARDKLTRWARFDPDWHRAELLGAHESGNAFAVSFHLDRLLGEYPFDAGLHVQQAHALARLGRPAEATAHLMHALFLHPQVHPGLIDPTAARRGQEAAAAGDWKQAVAAFELAVQQPVASPRLLVDLALAQTAAGMRQEAGETLRHMTARLPATRDRSLRWDFIFHAAYLPLDESTATTLVSETAANLAKERDADTLLFHGAALFRAGRLDEAAKVLAESARVHGRGGQVQSILFQYLVARDLGRLEEAREHLARVEAWHAGHKPPGWRDRVLWDSLLGEARRPHMHRARE
jgi:Flp pilus assembly protein TadD